MTSLPNAQVRAALDGVGPRLRVHREAAGLSLRQFARNLGVSPSFVSQLETGKAKPSVSSLYSICSALGLSLDELFNDQGAHHDATATGPGPSSPAGSGPAALLVHDGDAEGTSADSIDDNLVRLTSIASHGPSPLVTPEQRRRLVLDSGVVWEQLSSLQGSAVDFLFVRYDVGGSSTPDERVTRHSGIEFGYLLTGELEVSLGFESYRMSPGDSICFDSSTPHRLFNSGTEPVEALWFVYGRNHNTP